MKVGTMMTYDAIVLAGGKGTRSNLPYNKVLHLINDKTILAYAAQHFLDDSRCKRVIIVAQTGDYDRIKTLFTSNKVKVVTGGKTRPQSVKNGLSEVKCDYVLIHDGARAYFKASHIDHLLESLKAYQGVSLAVKVVDTLKKVKNNVIVDDLKRDEVYKIQTPQAFHTKTIHDAYTMDSNQSFTCDASRVRTLLNIPVKIIEGSVKNIKFTEQSDLELLELIINDENRL